MDDNKMTPSDFRAVLDANNGNNGFAYPVYPYGGGFGNSGFSGDWIWLILILALFNGNGFGGGFGGSYGNEYAWLTNGQKEIMQNTNDGFNTLHLSNQVEGVRDGINSLSNQLCNCCADMNATVNSGFANAETSANARQMANMQQAFNNQLSTMQGFNNMSSQFADCCCENRLANCQTQNIIQNEGNATRFADANNTRDIIDSQNRNSQAILDKLCQLELDNVKAQLEAKNDLIDQLRQENLYARGQASQIAQTAELRRGQEAEVDALYNRLSNCPVPSTPVYGRIPIFTCNGNNGCGCGNTFGNTIV